MGTSASDEKYEGEKGLDKCEKRLRNKITMVSFVCSLLVIWIHTYNLGAYGITADDGGLAGVTYFVEYYWDKLTDMAVPLFFVISGFLFFRTFSFAVLKDKYRTRARSVLLPYVCWCSIYYLYFVALTNLPGIRNLMSSTEHISIGVMPWLRWLWPDSYYVLWFLKSLILFILFTPVIYILMKDWHRKIPTGFVVLAAVFVLNWMQKTILSAGECWYLLGCWIAINHKEWGFYQNKKLSWLAVLYMLLCLVTGFRVWNIWTQLGFVIAFWLAFDFVKIPEQTPWWMQITFFTYVAHDIVLEVMKKVILIVTKANPSIALAEYICLPVLVFGILVLIAYLMKKIMPSVWKVLSGGR
jgi:surface polysaccharide O-acyltransferase-like enzyme